MADTDGIKFSFARLNNDNYQNWKFRIKMLLIREGNWCVIESARPAVENEEWLKKDGKAQATISLSIEDNQIVHIYKCKSAKEMWTELQKVHERNNLSNKLYLLRKLYQSRLENKVMSDYIKDVLELIERLRGVGEVIKDFHVAALLLGGLPDSYSTLVTALDTRPDDELTLEYVKGKLMDEYARKCNGGQEEVALNVKRNTEVQESRECYYCHRKGHLKKDCYGYKKFLKKKEVKKNGQAKTAVEKESGEFCFHTSKNNKLDTVWIVDSGATSHMCNDKSQFSSLDLKNFERIIVANGEYMDVKGKGDVVLKVDENTKIRLLNVLYIPELENNLLSVSKITDAGGKLHFDGNNCHINMGNKFVTIAKYQNKLYTIEVALERANLVKTSCEKLGNCLHLWHRRLGHRHPGTIKELVERDLADGIKLESCDDVKQCISCVEGKLTRKAFPKISDNQSNKILDLIHSDVCGPMRTSTVSGMRYLLTFTDDYSRYTKIYLLQSKDEVLSKTKEYIMEIWNEFNQYPKILRSDNGREYVAEKVQSYLKSKGIKIQLTVPYSPEQNGVSERKNRTLVETARCMLLDAGLPHKYWGEAIMTANYITNRLPTKSRDRTPYEIWTGNKPNLSNLITFGSQCFTFVPKEKRSKLDKKTKTGIMVGYSQTSKGYRILDPETDKVTVSRTVKFNEFVYQPYQETNNCKQRKNLIVEVNSGEDDVQCRKLNDENTETDKNDMDNEDDVVNEEVTEENDDEFVDSVSEVADLNENTGRKRNTEENIVTRYGRTSKKKSYEDYVSYNVISDDFGVSGDKIQLSDPLNVSEAKKRSDWSMWKEAMEEEYNSLILNEAWVLVDPPMNMNLVENKWVFCIKKTSNGEKLYKARLVAKGFSQQKGIDYHETFSPVVRYSTVRLIFALAILFKLKIDHLDVKTAFLHGEVDHEIYMAQPEGFIDKNNEHKVCLLKKAIYGLKQSSRIWYLKVKDVLLKFGLNQSSFEPCVYFKKENDFILIVALYVDDFIVCSNSESMKNNVKEELSKHFNLKDLGEIKQFLGMNVIHDKVNNVIKIDQKHYIHELLIRFKLLESKIAATPIEKGLKLKPGSKEKTNLPYQNLIGALMYLAVLTRPDISYSISYLSQFNTCFEEEHWKYAKRILRYLKGTINKSLVFSGSNLNIVGYVDADFSNNVVDRKSYTGYVFTLCNGAISWECKKQSCVALSSTEAEYIAISEAGKEAVFINNLVKELVGLNHPIQLLNDSQSAQKLIQNPMYHNRTKHIDTRYHYIRELVEKGVVSVKYLPTNEMLADVMTKGLHKSKHIFCITNFGLY